MRLVHVAVETAAGPHVTPQAFGVAHGHAWLVAAESTVKVRAIRRRPKVGLLFRDGGRSLLVRGHAEVLSPRSAADVVELGRLGTMLACAAGDYAGRNGQLLAGYLADLAESPADAFPADRVLVRVTPTSRRYLGDEAADLAVAVGLIGAEAPAVAELLAGDIDEAVVGLSSPAGPVVVPVRWDGSVREALVPSATLADLGIGVRASACLTLHRSPGLRPSRFSGVLLRGEVVRSQDRAALTVERVTWWRGFDAASALAA